ncbi:MAG: hypothetical protein OEZ58_24190 [Gammaproteobacteria bacterium]|nr:hypothetical protein [Gammaproteobacteria bacterium]MDH5732097.1 hypothetical protein [Gammaproteobacteria bacterium]
MTQNITDSIICNQCGFIGQASSGSAKTFVVFMILLCSSAYFLPMVIVALAYMAWMISLPAKKTCPKCKSADLSPYQAKSETQAPSENMIKDLNEQTSSNK